MQRTLLAMFSLALIVSAIHAQDREIEKRNILKDELYEEHSISDRKLLDTYYRQLYGYQFDKSVIENQARWLIQVKIGDLSSYPFKKTRLTLDTLKALNEISELRELTVASMDFTNEIIQELSTISQLEDLTLAFYQKEGDKSFPYDLAPLKNLKNLKFLDLRGNFSNADLLKLDRVNKNLRKLDIHNSNSDGTYLEEYRVTFPNITSLRLATPLSERGLKAALKFPELKFLDLSSAQYDIKLLDLFCENSHKHKVDIQIRFQNYKEVTLEKYKELAIKAINYRKLKFPNDPDVWFINNPFIFILTQEELEKLK